MSLSASLVPRAVAAPDCPSYTPATTRATELLAWSEEAWRFGWCTGIYVAVPIVSVDAGEDAAIAELAARPMRLRAYRRRRLRRLRG